MQTMHISLPDAMHRVSRDAWHKTGGWCW